MSTITMTVRATRPVLQRLLSVTPAKQPAALTALTYVRVAAAGGQINMRATDGEIDLTIGLPGHATGDGVFLIPARPFRRLVTKLKPDEPITIRQGKGTVEISSGPTTLSYPWLSPDTFPEPPDAGKSPSTHLLDLDAVRSVVDICPEEHVRQSLCGVRVEGRYYVATDLFRMYVTSAPAIAKDVLAWAPPDLLIPRRAAKILSTVGGIHRVLVNNDDKTLILHARGQSIKVRLFDPEQYVDWHRIPPLYEIKQALTFKDDFMDMLTRLATLADAAGNGGAVSFPPGSPIVAEVRGQSTDPNMRATITTITGRATGECFRLVSFNPKYLLGVLKDAKTKEIRCDGNPGPAVASWDENGYRYSRYLMPVRM